MRYFDLNAQYDESKQMFYTKAQIKRELDESGIGGKAFDYEVEKTEKLCGLLCPLSMSNDISLDPYYKYKWKKLRHFYGCDDTVEMSKDKTDYCSQTEIKRQQLIDLLKGYICYKRLPEIPFEKLKFTLYIAREEKKCAELNFSLADCITEPSLRYLRQYAKMMSDIQGNVSSDVRKSINSIYSNTHEVRQNQNGTSTFGRTNLDSGWSVNRINRYIGDLAVILYDLFDEDFDALENAYRQFCLKMMELYRPPSYDLNIRTCWDELYVRLAYNKEGSLLRVYNQVLDISHRDFPEGSEYANIRNPARRMLQEKDFCLLRLDCTTEKIIEIGEKEASRAKVENNGHDDKKFCSALKSYVNKNCEDIAKKVFCKEYVTSDDLNKIKKCFDRIYKFYDIEVKKYNGVWTKARLISMYQVYFMSLERSGLSLRKLGTPKSTEPDGTHFRDNPSLSSTFLHPEKKDPVYLQLIHVFVDYQFLWNCVGPVYAEKFLSVNVEALKSIRSGGAFAGPQKWQLQAESVFLDVIDTLIPDRYGDIIIQDCIEALNSVGLNFRLKPLGSFVEYWQKEITLLGKCCYLIGVDKNALVKKIREEIHKEEKGSYRFTINDIFGNVFQMHEFWLHIGFNKEFYILTSFARYVRWQHPTFLKTEQLADNF